MTVLASINEILPHIKNEIDARKAKKIKVSILYAFNASGKTRLSKLFVDQYHEQVLCYNAFIEDLFSWDNENYILNIDINSWVAKLINEHGLENQIIDNFQNLTGTKLQPTFHLPEGEISFHFYSGDTDKPENIKISKGEESVFIWSIFYTILCLALENLNEEPENRETREFDGYQYIIIDDPVSSVDDTKIIKIALELRELIYKSNNKVKFFITTHHALFFNILFNSRNKYCSMKSYILSKSDAGFHLEKQETDAPFAYHHVVRHEIERAIKNEGVQKYHFNLFRALLEKTANFLGYRNWEDMLVGDAYGKVIKKTLHHYSHNSLSTIEPKDLSERDKEDFKAAFNSFAKEFKWGVSDYAQ